MTNVVPLIRPIEESKLIEALREITDDTTDAVIVITRSGNLIAARTFGPDAVEVLIDMATAISEGIVGEYEGSEVPTH